MTVSINLTKGYTAIIDDADKDLAAFKWHCYPYKGAVYAKRAVYVGDKKQYVFLHRLVMERVEDLPLPNGRVVDHINCDTLDNRRSNLRLATHAENIRNQKKQTRNTSGFKGVCFMKSIRRWVANISVNGKQKYLGSFDTPELAHAAYCKAGRELHGEFFNPGDNS